MPRRITGAKVEGVPELAARIKDLGEAMASSEAYKVLGEVSSYGARAIRSYTSDRNWPHDIQGAIYSYAKPQPSRRGHPASLFGIRKRGRKLPWAPGYVEWGKRIGKVVGESLATMFEYGTSKMSPRPAVRPAIASTRSVAPGILQAGFKGIIERHAK